MKSTDKEWLAFAFRVAGKQADADVELYNRIGPKSKVRWSRTSGTSRIRFATFESEIRYFATPRDEEDQDENDLLAVRTVRDGRQLRFIYPMVSWRLQLEEQAALLLAVPYVALAREILARSRLRFEGEIEFAAPTLEKVFTSVIHDEVSSIDEALKSDRLLMLLRAGRVNFAADANLRAAVLLGDNVFESALYKQLAPSLDETGEVWLGADVARMAFWGATRRRLVAQLDRYGNFKLRVGSAGERLGLLAEMIEAIGEQGAIEWRGKFPALRVQELS